jgi:hypothetical protein
MMKFSFNLKGLGPSVRKQFEKESLPALAKLASLALVELKAATPVDTGEASESWEYYFAGKNTVVLENSAAHIVFLNAGSSEQAPAYFIENVILKYGKPIGPIVTYK